ncbi:MAG: selenide, water dikinase SelD [Bacteroidetes bacterium GWF2_41_31]|nr:MAG: selenide, water dikinase SelD [Bacteroidetes bacterium GWF2_41_31]
MNEIIRLTQYSHGAGCGCKISPKVLDTILKTEVMQDIDKNLLVGNDSRDDAAVYDLGDGTAIISTTDFFLPIVDDPFAFGKIAAVNAISDVYAMGGTPLLAIAILGWPVDKIPPEIASQVMEGGRAACKEAGIMLAGGHSIDNPEPVFGLAVTGRIDISKLKKNNSAKPGSKLYLTKSLGVGILATAQKQGILKEEHQFIARDSMMILNKVGARLADIEGVNAMTDVTGFGLLGHLLELCEGSGVSAVIDYKKVPIFAEAIEYLNEGAIPGGTNRNWDSYGHKLKLKDEEQKNILCDPQTSGGLLISVDENYSEEVEALLKGEKLISHSFGYLTDKDVELIKVIL